MECSHGQDLGKYDMIIGRDLLKDHGINICFSNDTIIWDDHDMPFKDSDQDPKSLYHVCNVGAANAKLELIKQILNEKYKPADLDKVTAEKSHLFQKYLHLFD